MTDSQIHRFTLGVMGTKSKQAKGKKCNIDRRGVAGRREIYKTLGLASVLTQLPNPSVPGHTASSFY